MVQTRAIGPSWLTGGDLGPEGALFTPLFLLAAIAVVIRSQSHEWAWHYTHQADHPGWLSMTAPPAAHTAMEQAPEPPALMQFLPEHPADPLSR